MKALQIGMGAGVGGINGLDRYYFDLVRALPASGTQVKGYVSGETAYADNVESFAAQGSSFVRRWAGLRSAIAGPLQESDVVVSHFAPHVFGMLDQIRKKPFVIHFHGPWAGESAAEGASSLTVAAKRALERIVYNRGARFIVLSKAFGSVLESEYGVPKSAIHRIPGGVDVQRFSGLGSRTDARRTLGWPQDRPIVATVRRLVHAKGLENLIEATKRVRERIPNVLVVIAGTGALEQTLKRSVAAAGLEQSVRFEGFVADADLPRVYRAADLFVVPTITLEGFGLVVIEALACGTPVIVTPVGGLPEAVSGLDPGLVLSSFEPGEIARGITAALEGTMRLPDEDECRAYAADFDWPKIASRVSAVYRDALN